MDQLKKEFLEFEKFIKTKRTKLSEHEVFDLYTLFLGKENIVNKIGIDKIFEFCLTKTSGDDEMRDIWNGNGKYLGFVEYFEFKGIECPI